MITTNSMDARALGQPGGFFDSITQGLNRGVESWARARDRQDERDFNSKLLSARLGREDSDRNERLNIATEQRKQAALDRSMRWARESGVATGLDELPDDQRTAIEAIATATRQERGRKAIEDQRAEVERASRLAALGFDPAEFGYDMVPGADLLGERARQVSGDQQAERYAKGVAGLGQAAAKLRSGLGMKDPNAKPMVPSLRDFKTGTFGEEKTLMFDPATGTYINPPIAPGVVGGAPAAAPVADAAAAPAPKGIVRGADLKVYARKHGMDEASAADYLTRNGYQIEAP